MREFNLEDNLEEIKDLYLNRGCSAPEIAKKVGCGLTTLCRFFRKNNIVKNEEQREKEGLEKRKKTLRKKYGIEYTFQSKIVQEKTKKTMKQRYGVEHNWNNGILREKEKQTWIEKYGEDCPLKAKEIRKKITKTRIERGLEIDKDKLRNLIENNLNAKQISKMTGFCSSTVLKNANKSGLKIVKNIATEHCEIVDFIRKELSYKKTILFAPETSEYYLKNKQRLDIYFPDLKIGIEYNGYATHNSDVNLMSPEAKPKESSYHFNKFLQCEKEGIRLISIWDIDWNNPFYRRKIENILTNVFRPDLLTKIYARKTKIKELDYTTYAKFLNDYHFKNAKVSKYRFGLYYNDELVEVMGFSDHKVYQYELDRGCVHPKYIVVGGSQKLFKYFINKYNPNTILTFSDNDLFTGNTYLRLGFDFVGYTKGSLFWVNMKTEEKLYRNPFKHKEYMKLYREGKLLKCFNSGNKKFIWRKNAEKE